MKRRIIHWSTLIMAICILVAVILYTRQLIAEQIDRRRPAKPTQIQRPEVSILTVIGANYTAKIHGYGETSSHYALTLTAQTNGQVIQQSAQLEPGCQVHKGDILVQLEDSDYVSAVADAKSELESARLALLEEQREASQAQVEWKSSGLSGEPDSDLVLHGPQLDAAKAVVAKAEAALLNAEKELSRTLIRAPFDAIVVERFTSPGSYLQTGTTVASLYSTDMVEVPVPFSTKDWNNLPDTATLNGGQWPAQLIGVEDGQSWSGRVLRAEQHVDSTTRQRSLMVAVDSPFSYTPPLLPGTFVEVKINGKAVENVWELPSSALSQRGEIWYVNEGDTLARFAAEPVFSNGNFIYVEVPESLASVPTKIVVHPLSSYLPGMAVQPVVEDNNA